MLLFVHEMGHVIAGKAAGLLFGPVFIPFMGALITMKQDAPERRVAEFHSARGPLLGSAGALGLYILGAARLAAVEGVASLGFLASISSTCYG